MIEESNADTTKLTIVSMNVSKMFVQDVIKHVGQYKPSVMTCRSI